MSRPDASGPGTQFGSAAGPDTPAYPDMGSGIWPPPEFLQAYALLPPELLPLFAEWIAREQEYRHNQSQSQQEAEQERHKMAMELEERNSQRRFRLSMAGVIAAALATLLSIAGCIFLVAIGRGWFGLGLIGVNLTCVISLFLYGVPRRGERRRIAQELPQTLPEE